MIVLDEQINGVWLKHKRVGGKSVRTQSYHIWTLLKQRCENENSFVSRPTYKDCYISEHFKDFHNFANWCVRQIGYGVSGYELDKDILVSGNKEYSEETCVFIPQALNCFLVANGARRGKWPLGVTFNKREQKFKSSLRVDGKKIHLGYFDNPESAYMSYKCAKEDEARRWASRLLSNEFVVDPRVINVLINWKLNG